MTRKPSPQVLPATDAPSVLDEIFSAPNVSRETLQLHYVPLGRVIDNPYQTRLKNVPDHVLGLASSLLQMTPSLPDTKGLQQVPIGRVVNYGDSTPAPAAAYSSAAQLRRLLADPAYVVELAFGHSRRLAFEVLAKGVATVFPDLAGTEQVALKGAEFDPALYADMPVLLMPIADADMWVHATTENGHREDISAIEEALAIKRATTELGMTLEQAGKAMNKSRSAASNLVRLLELPDQYQQAIFDGVMSEKHGRTLLSLRGAYHLFHATPADVGAMSTRELETAIKAQIGRCRPIAPQGNTRYMGGNGYNATVGELYSPPAWPLGWPGDGDPQIVGACEGCQWRITFAGDPGPRCTHKESSGRSCYGAKDDRWEAMERAKQARVAAARLAEQQVPAQPAPTAMPAQTDDAAQPGAAASQPASAANPAPQAKVTDSDVSVQWFVSGYSYGNAPAALLERGMCSQEKCECFVLAYNRFANEKNIRPDPQNAPNMCYGCTSKGRMQHRNQQLEHGDVKALRQAIKAENEACEELVRRALYELPTGRPWWNNAVFLRDMVAATSEISKISTESGVASADASQLTDKIWMAVAGHKCRQWSNMTVDGNAQHWKMERVQKWLRSLEIPAKLAMGIWVELAAGESQPEPVAEEPIEVVTIPADPGLAQLSEFMDLVRGELATATAADIDAATDVVFPPPEPTPTAPANEVPADLAAHGWQLHGGVRGWQMTITVDGETLKSRWYREPAGAIGDAHYMDRELKLGEESHGLE